MSKRKVTILLTCGVETTFAPEKIVFHDVPPEFIVGARKNAKPLTINIPLADDDREGIVDELGGGTRDRFIGSPEMRRRFEEALAGCPEPPHSAIPVSRDELAGMIQAGAEDEEDIDERARRAEREAVKMMASLS